MALTYLESGGLWKCSWDSVGQPKSETHECIIRKMDDLSLRCSAYAGEMVVDDARHVGVVRAPASQAFGERNT